MNRNNKPFATWTMRSFIALLLVVPLHVFAQPDPDPEPPGWTDRIKYIVGQDTLALQEYREAVDQPGWFSPPKVPNGVTLYTSIVEDPDFRLRGFDGETFFHPIETERVGRVNFEQTLYEDYPGAELSVGLYMVDCANNLPIKAIGGITGSDGATNQQITRYRGYVDTLLEKLDEFERMVYLRIGYEYDGDWFCYDQHPDAYVAAFRYIHNRIKERDLDDRIATVWQTAAWPGEGFGQTHMYPGDDVVDYIGMSTFYGENYDKLQWNCPQAPNVAAGNTPQEMREQIVAFANAHKKALMISEASPQGYDIENDSQSDCLFNRKGNHTVTNRQIWDDWYKDWFDFIHDNSETISHVAYINVDWQEGTDQGNWKCADSEDGQDALCPKGYWGDSRLQADFLTKVRFNNQLYLHDWIKGMKKGSAHAEILSYAQGTSRVWTAYVPPGASDLVIDIAGGNGDADLYVRYGKEPTLTKWDCRPYRSGNNEQCTFAAPQAGTYYIMVRAYHDYSDVSLALDYEGGNDPQTDVPGVVTQNAGVIANGDSTSWDVNVTQSGNLKLLISSTSSQNSQLIQVTFNGESITQAIDASGQHQTIEVYYSNVPSGANQISVKALSNHVSIGKVEVITW